MRRFLCLILGMTLLAPRVSAEERTKYAALTFDDGPSGCYTETLLEGLAQRGVHATFFLCGYRLETYSDLARQIRQQGHEIGLHGYTHNSMAKMTPEQIKRELIDTQALLPQGYFVNLMRPPGGAMDGKLRQAARDLNLAIISWSVDPRDWATASAVQIEQSVLQQTTDGDIILLHDMSSSSVEAALNLVDQLQSQGYEFLTVSQLAMLRGCFLRSGQVYSRFTP